jgi:CHAT domain-containing protein
MIRRFLSTPFLALLAAACVGCAEVRDPRDGLDASRERLTAAQSLYYAGQYDSAAMAFDALRRHGEESGDVSSQAAATMWLGFAANRRAVYDSARIFGERALVLQIEHHLTDQLPRAYNALGLLAWEEYRLADAESLFVRSVQIAEQAEMPYAAAVAQGNLGLTLLDLGDYEGARTGLEVQLRVSVAHDSIRSAAAAATNLSALSIREGDPLTAVQTLRGAIRTFRQLDDPSRLQNAYAQLGEAYADLGEPRLAFGAFDTAIAVARRLGNEVEAARNMDGLAALHQRSGNLHRALELYDQARAVRDSLGQTVEAAWNLRNSAAIHAALGDLQRAQDAASRAAAVHEDAGLQMEQLDDAILLAELARLRGDTAAAGAHLDLARGRAASVGSPWPHMRVELVSARFELEDDEPDAALARLRSLEPMLASVRDETRAEALGLLARALARTGRLDEAATVGARAIDALERIRRRFGSSELRTTFLHERLDVYGDQAAVLFRLGRIDDGFSVVDAARGRGLTAHLASARATRPAMAAVASGDQLLRRIAELTKDLDNAAGDPHAEDAVRGQLERARTEYDEAVRDARERLGTDAPLLGLEAIGLDEVQRSLEPDEAVLEYLVTDDRVWILAVTPRQVLPLSSEIGATELAGRVRVARDLLASPENDRDIVAPVLEGLHDLLVGPALRSGVLADARLLTVVPHTVLNYLPFAALVDPTTGAYVIEEFELRYLPSGAAIAALAARADGSVNRPAPSGPGGDRMAEDRDVRDRAALFAPREGELPYTVEEIRRIDAVLARSDRFVGRRASEARVRRELARNRTVHLATHGVMNAENPMFSRVELAGGRQDRPEDDGRLEVHEVLDMEIASTLVFLSGCETGVGAAWSTADGRGEDHTTLERAFLYAGAANVIATLWPVDDAGAAALAVSFYAASGADGSPSADLARAQRKLIGDPEWSAPFYWAGVRLSGANRAGLH